MNKMILPAAVAAICAMGLANNEASAADKAKNATLGDLSCLENQIAEFDGELWACIDKPSDGEPGVPGPPGEQGPPGEAGGAPQYEFVDGLGNLLGDVVFIENSTTAWGYFDYLSTDSIIKVTASTDKSGWLSSFSGNFSRINPGVYYLPSDPTCSGTAYASRPGVNVPLMWDFLVSEPFYYVSNNAMWWEVIFSEAPAPTGEEDSNWFLMSYPGGPCEVGGVAYSPSMREVSFSAAVAAPIERPATFIVEKP